MALPAKFSTQRVLILAIPTVLLLTFLSLAFRGGSLSAPFDAIKGGASQSQQPSPQTPPTSSLPPTHGGFGDLISALYKPIKVPVTADSYVDQRGNKFDTGGRQHWKAPLGKDIVVVDIDTRIPLGENDVFNTTKTMDWEKVHASGPGLLTVSHVNHFLYSQIHGYDYKYFHAQKIQGHYSTWIKPHALQEMLRGYKFVVFIDADAIIQHLEVPLEFLFNRWDVSPHTSIALPVDTQQVLEGNNISLDGKGKVVLNTGVVVLQNLPHTHEMMDAWKDCTSEKKYPGCGQWKEKWSHEQRAFSEYIRYDFNPQGNNIVEIPCNDANGFPGLHGQFGVIDDCKGEFIRHYTIDKNMAKTSTGDAIVQTMGELLQKNFAATRHSMLIEEPAV